jgi:hypothetical protein
LSLKILLKYIEKGSENILKAKPGNAHKTYLTFMICKGNKRLTIGSKKKKIDIIPKTEYKKISNE